MPSRSTPNRIKGMAGARAASLIAAAGLALSISSRALAQTDAHWTNASSGNWTDATRWSTNPLYPHNGGGSSYRAFIDAVGSNYVITSSGDVLLDYLRLNSANATLRLTSGVFTAPTIDLMAGTLDLEGGTITNSTINMNGGLISSSSNSIFDGDTFNGTFAANFGGHVRHGLTANGEMSIGGQLTLDGSQTLTGTFAISNTSGFGFVLGTDPGTGLNPTITLSSGSTIHGSSASGTGFRNSYITDGVNVTGQFINNGTVSSDSLHQSLIFSVHQFTNNGLLQAVNGGVLRVNNLSGNANSVNVDGASSQMFLGGSYTLNAPVSVTNGAMLDLSGSWTNAAGIVASGANTLINLHGSMNATSMGSVATSGGARIGMAGDYDNTGQTLAFSPANAAWSLTGGSITGGTISTAGGESVRGWGALHGVNNTGVLIVGANPGDTLTIDGNWSNSGAITFGAASTTLTLGGTVTTAGLGSIASTGGTVSIAGTIDNSGSTLALDSSRANWAFTNGTINGGTISGGTGGIITTLGSARTATINNATLTGTFAVNIGTLFTTNLVNQGAVTVHSSMALNGAWSNPGTITLIGTSLSLGGAFPYSAMSHITNGGGTLIITGALDLTGQSMSSDQWGRFTLDGGSITGGTITGVGTGDRFQVINHTSSTLSGVAVSGTFSANEFDGNTHTSLFLTNGTTVSGAVTSRLSMLDIDATSSINNTLNLFNGGSLNLHGTRTQSSEVVLWDHSTSFPTNIVGIDAGATLTIAPTGSIHGFAGSIGSRLGTGGPTAIINQGRIAQDLSTGTLSIDADTLTNNGTVEATGGGQLLVNHLQGNLNTARVTGSGSRLVLDGSYTINAAITATSGTLTLNGAWTNTGGINATNATINLGGAFTSAGIGTITRVGSTLVNISGVLNNTGSTLSLGSASSLIGLNGGTILGGTVATSNGQRLFQRGGNSSLLGVNVTGDVTVAGGTLTPDLASSFGGEVAFTNGVLQFPSGATVASGTYNFTATSAGSELRNVPGASPTTLTLGPSVVVHGAVGAIGEAGGAGAPNTIVNQGLISADVSGRTITVAPDVFNNSGVIQAINGGALVVNNLQGSVGTAQATGTGSQLTLNGTYSIDSPLNVNGATLTLSGSWTNTAGVVANNATINLGGSFATSAIGSFARTGTTSLNIVGQLNNTGDTLLVDSASNNFGLAGGTITGGTIATANSQRFTQVSGNSTLSGVSVPGDVTIAGGTLTASGGTAFTGEVAIGAGAMQFPTGSTIPSGTFRYTGVSSSVLRAVSSGTGATLTLGPDVTIRGGGGNLGTQSPDNTTITNYGLISADLPGQVLTVNAFLNNLGTVQAVNGGELDVIYPQHIGNATVSGAGSVLVFSLNPFTITSPISTVNGGRLVLGGNWTNSSTINIDHATLDLGGNFGPAGLLNGIANNGGNVRITGTLDGRGQTVTIPTGLNLSVNYQLWSDTLNIPAGESLAVSGTLQQRALTGGGNVVMSGGTIVQPTDNATLLIGSGITVTGYGAVLGSGTAGFPMTNAGTIRADVSGQTMAVGSNTWVNTGTVEAVNGGLLTINGSGWSNSGLIRAGDGCTLTLNGSYSFAGGTIDAQGTGSIIVRGTVNNAGSTLTATGNILLDGPTISGGTVNVPTGALHFAVPNSSSGVRFSGVTLNGAVEVTGSTGSTGRLVYFQNGLAGNSAIHVTGASSTLTFENTETIAGANIFIDSAAAGTRRIVGAPNQTYTFAPTTVVRGGGFSMFDPLGFGSNQTLINQGLISADVAGQSIVVNPTTFSNQGTVEAINGATLRVGDAGQGTMPWTNTGTLRVGAGSVLQLGGIFTLGSTTVQNSGGSLQLFGRLNNAGHTLTLDSPNNSMGLYNACTIAGGSVSVSNGALVVPSDGGGNLDGVALSGDVTTSSRLALLNGTSFTGNIRIPDGGRLDIGAYPYAQYVLSTGTVQFDGNTTYPTLGADNLVIGPNVLVHGGNGQFGRTANNSGTWSWVNQGRISADVPGKRILVNGVDNYGTLEAINGGTLSVGGTFEPGSVLRAINSTFEMLGGPAALIGSMERTNATVNLGGVIDNGGNVLNMDAATQWGFMGGVRFKGGTVNLAPGANFTLGVGIPAQPITLENLAFNGDMVTSPTQLEVDIRHLALNGILTLRTPLSKAVFIDDQTFSSGTIFFDPSGGPGQRQVTPRGLGPNGEGFSTIIFGPSAVLRGGDGLIRLSWGAGALGTFINQGLVSADIANTVIGIEQQRFVNTGIVQAINGGEIDYQGPPPFSGGDPWVLQNSGTLFAGAGSRLLLDALESSSDSVLRFAIGGLADYGQISASSIQFDGTLLVTLEDGFVPASGERFSLLSYGTGSGQFAAIDLPSLPQGLSWNTSGLYETGSIQIVPAPAALSLLAGFVLLRRRRRA